MLTHFLPMFDHLATGVSSLTPPLKAPESISHQEQPGSSSSLEIFLPFGPDLNHFLTWAMGHVAIFPHLPASASVVLVCPE